VRPDSNKWSGCIEIRCRNCAQTGKTPRLLGFLAQQRRQELFHPTYGLFDSSRHDNIQVRRHPFGEGTISLRHYLPHKGERCLHIVRHHKLRSDTRAIVAERDETTSGITACVPSLPIGWAFCRSCRRDVLIDRDELLARMHLAQPLLA